MLAPIGIASVDMGHYAKLSGGGHKSSMVVGILAKLLNMLSNPVGRLGPVLVAAGLCRLALAICCCKMAMGYCAQLCRCCVCDVREIACL